MAQQSRLEPHFMYSIGRMDLNRFGMEIAPAAIDAAVRPDHWGTLCDVIAAALGAPAFMVFAYDTESHVAPVAHVTTNLRTPLAISLLSKAQSSEAQEDHRGYNTLANLAPGRVIGEREGFGIGPNDPLPANAFRDMALRASGGRSRSAVKLNGYGPFLDCAISHHKEPGGFRSEALQTAAPYLVPLLARTLESSRVVAALTETYSMLMSLFDQLDFGAAFCDPSGRIVVANRTFKEMAAEEDSIGQSGGYLRAQRPEYERALRASFAAAGQPGSGPEHLTVTLGRRSGALPLVVYVMPVAEKDIAKKPLRLALFIDPESSSRLSSQGLAAFGMLSPAELDVCGLLVRGHSTGEIAERRGTSAETARGQIKNATAKLACRGRIELVRLALATASPMRQKSQHPPRGG